MLTGEFYIQVILPLKLGWEPFYLSSEPLEVGDRVRVPFAGNTYLAVVSGAPAELPPGIKPLSVKRIFGKASEKAHVSATELDFFRKVASYYMCTVGEVYKAAYPAVKDETVRPRSKACETVSGPGDVVLSDREKELLDAVHSAHREGKVCLLSSPDSSGILRSEALSHIRNGGNVLYLVPEMKFSARQEKMLRSVFGDALILYGSNVTPAKKREAARRIRSGSGYIVIGTRSSIFLPHRGLTLVIVRGENEISYKQTSPSPRYNGRDCAVMLAGIFGAGVLLESVAPSFESIYNSLCGKYVWVKPKGRMPLSCEVIDTRSELKKNGMSGEVPLKLVQMARECRMAVYKPHYASFPDIGELSSDVRRELGEDVFITENLVSDPIPGGVRKTALFGMDSLLGRDNFRADERALQTILSLGAQCPEVVVMTRESSHSVFRLLTGSGVDLNSMLAERRQFNLPPYTRLVDILLTDAFPDRLARMKEELYRGMVAADFAPMEISGGFRVALKRDASLAGRKSALLGIVSGIEKTHRYTGHITFDVDPR